MLLFALWINSLPPPEPKAAPQKIEMMNDNDIPHVKEPSGDDLPVQLEEDMEKDDDDDILDDEDDEDGGDL